ncbi:MAG: hypothetical protein AB7E46_04550 [Desulfovibrio sp.]
MAAKPQPVRLERRILIGLLCLDERQSLHWRALEQLRLGALQRGGARLIGGGILGKRNAVIRTKLLEPLLIGCAIGLAAFHIRLGLADRLCRGFGYGLGLGFL